MADKVKHWPDGMNWYARDEGGSINFCDVNMEESFDFFVPFVDGKVSFVKLPMHYAEKLSLAEIDPDTPWYESKQRKPE